MEVRVDWLSPSMSPALGGLQIVMGPCKVRRYRQAPYSLQTHLASGYCPVQQVSFVRYHRIVSQLV